MASTKNFSQGFREIDYKFELLDSDNSVIGDVTNLVESAEVTNNSFSSIQRTAKFNIVERPVNSPTVTQLASKSFWQAEVLPSQWTGDIQQWQDLLAYPRGERQSSSVNPVFEIKRVGISEPPVYDSIDDNYGGYYRGWTATGDGGSGDYGGLSRSGTGIINNTQKFNKTVSWSTYLATYQNYRLPLTGSTRTIRYCGFFRSSSVSMPNVGYMKFNASESTKTFVWFPDSDITLTDVSSPSSGTGWKFFSGTSTIPASDATYTKISLAIGLAQAGAKQGEYDQFWWSLNRTTPYTFEVEGLSPVLDASIPNLVNSASLMRMANSSSDWNGSGNRTPTGCLPEMSILEIRKRSNGGAWSGWLPLLPLSGVFSENEDMRGKEVQLRWRARSYDRDTKNIYSFMSLWNWKLKVSAQTTMENPAYTGINYNKHRIKPYLKINEDGNWQDYPLGIFLLNTPTRAFDGASTTRDIEAYDQMVIMQESKNLSKIYGILCVKKDDFHDTQLYK